MPPDRRGRLPAARVRVARPAARLLERHLVLAALSAALLIVFGGITDRLIPLFAIGAFLAFTLSQAGMVAHWLRVGGPHAPQPS